MAEDNEAAEERSGGIKSLVFKLLPYVLILALGVMGGIYTAQQKPSWFGLSKGVAAVQAETDALIASVGRLIALPGDENPTVATVTDIDKVKDQPFFKNAQNGDKVLIYTKAQKAIIYRPGENRIIEVGAVNINNQQPPQSPVPSESPSPTPKAQE
jgi:hypothetical protein